MKKYLILMFMMFSINILVKSEVHGFIPIDTLILNKNIYIKFKTPDILSNPLITAKQVNDIIYDCFGKQNVYDLSKRSNILYDDKDSSVKSYPCNEYITYKKYIYLKIKNPVNFDYTPYNKEEILNIDNIHKWNEYILDKTKGFDDSIQKLYCLSYIITQKITYSKTNNGYDIDSIMKSNQTVCNGYTNLFKHSLNVLGFNNHGTVLLSETVSVNPVLHIMNYVILNDIKYYIDVTFMDNYVLNVNYFMFTDLDWYLKTKKYKVYK